MATVKQWGFTPAGASYPPYLNISKMDDGSYQVTVRSPAKPDGSCGDVAAMTMTAEDFRLYISEVATDAEPSALELGAAARAAGIVR